MKKSIKTLGTIAAMTIIAIGSYFLGATQAKTVTEIKEIETVVEVVPDGYIKLDECIPLEDIACYFIDAYDYPCFSLADVNYQLDDISNRSYNDIMNDLDDMTDVYINNTIDMRKVIDFDTTEKGLQIYLDDGSGYYWERQER